jgi:hypothetical protein
MSASSPPSQASPYGQTSTQPIRDRNTGSGITRAAWREIRNPLSPIEINAETLALIDSDNTDRVIHTTSTQLVLQDSTIQNGAGIPSLNAATGAGVADCDTGAVKKTGDLIFEDDFQQSKTKLLLNHSRRPGPPLCSLIARSWLVFKTSKRLIWISSFP